MGTKSQRRRLILAALFLIAAPLFLSAQDSTGQKDSLVRLISAKSLEQQETPEGLVRKAMGATFLHNGTYLISDSSMWYLDSSIIKCRGNVRLLQGETELTSERLDYLIDEDLAQFRGAVVQLRNKQENILRTNILDYNTRDSVAVFSGGASMKSENGQIIESDNGRYLNPDEYFFFDGNVNMFTDSVFVKTTALEYDSTIEKAWFTAYIDFWNEGNMLSADGGWYESRPDIFFFDGDVHALSEAQESWSDTLYYYRKPGDVLMLGSAQLQDTTRSVASVSDYLFYEDSLARVTLKKQAAVALWTEEEGQLDTTYFGADTLVYYTVRRCDIPEAEVEAARARLETILADPVADYRKRAAEEAAAAKEEAERKKEEQMFGPRSAARGQASASEEKAPPEEKAAPADSLSAPADSLSVSRDSLSVAANSLSFGRDSLSVAADSLSAAVDSLSAMRDSLATGLDSLAPGLDSLAPGLDSLAVGADSLAVADSLAAPLDTTRVGYLMGIGNARIFRRDMQVRSDSVRFCELDSIARFYKNPIVWNEGNRQYTSDSLFVLIRNNAADRASLMSNAFITVEEDTVHYDQIRSTEVMAYFNEDAALRRFDALGGVSALFYLEENDEIATVNKVESTMLSANFADGELESVYYFEAPKSDAYPVVQLPPEDSRLRGFNWQPDLRPASPEDITTLKVRRSERRHYESIPRPEFIQTERFFPGMMQNLYDGLEAAERRKRQAEQRRREAEQAEEMMADSLAMSDSLAVGVDSLALADSLAASDSLAVADSLAASASEEEFMSEAELRRAARIARRDARWAELDARDAEKAALKQRRREERLKKKEERKARIRARQEARDARLLQKYIEKFEKQKERDEREQEPEPAGERSPGIEVRGELSAAPRT